MEKWYFLLLALFAALGLQAADGHRIKVKIQDYEEKELYLAYYYGDKQYILDTATVGTDGFFDFAGEKPLESYGLSVRSLEKQLDMVFFPSLFAGVEGEKIKSRFEPEKWFFNSKRN